MKYDTLKALVNAKVYENTEQRITGGDMNNVLQSAIASLGAHYQMGGLVSPTDHITVGDEPVVFIATTPGTYTYFGSQVVADGEVALLVWSGTAWSKQTPDISTRTELSQLGQKIIYFVGFGATGDDAGVTEVGQYYVKNDVTPNVLKYKARDTAPAYDDIPWREDAIYICNSKLYVWDGSALLYADLDVREKLGEVSLQTASLGYMPKWNYGYYIFNTLQKLQSSDYCYSDPIPVNPGDKIVVNTPGSGLAIICSSDNSGNLISALVTSATANSNIRYSYIVGTETHIVLCYKYTASGVYFEINGIRFELSAKLIKLKGISTSGSGAGATSIGDVYYNTNSKTLQRKFRLSGNYTFETIPFLDGAIYQYDNAFYTWDGENLIKHPYITEEQLSGLFSIIDTIGADIPIPLSTDAQSIACGGKPGDIVNTTPQPSSAGFHYALVECEENDIFVINGVGGVGARLWCFIDSSNAIISEARQNIEERGLSLVAPPNSAKLIINSKSDGINYIRKSSGICNDIRELSEINYRGLFQLRCTPNLNAINESGRRTMLLCGLKTQITNDSMPFTDTLLWHEHPIATDNKLYYSNSINGELKEYGAMNGWNPVFALFAVSPKDGRVISTKNGTRGGICIFDGVNTNIIDSVGGVIPCGWLYNSGVDFINDGDDEYCIFAEYGYLNEYHIWRGKYPYTSESDWEIVFTQRGPLDNSPEITHFHTIRRDPWTDILYCTSGDYPGYAKWWYSLDKGLTWVLLTDGTNWEPNCSRSIGFVFTKDYAYWASDNGINHSFNRISRDPDTGIFVVSTKEKVATLPYGQATNSICYVESLNGVFFYERLDTQFQDEISGYYTLFYSFNENKLYKLGYYTLNQEDWIASGNTGTAWGGHRGKCYLNYTNSQIQSPAMGFDRNSCCIINMIGIDNRKIGTIYYD